MIDFTIPEILYLMPGYSPAKQALAKLATLIRASSVFQLNQKTAFMFCNRDKNIIRIIYWDGERFSELLYRLDQGTFKWPMQEPKFMEISLFQLERLLRGDSLNPLLNSAYSF